MTQDNRKDIRGGFYWKDNRPYVRVTDCSGIINKPQLLTWAAREVYRALAADPGMSEEVAIAAPFQSRDKAASRGTTVHSIVEAYKRDGNVLSDIPEEFRGYAEAFYRFMAESNTKLIEQEKTVYSDLYGVAGTTDIIDDAGDGWVRVTDVKTNKAGSVYPEHHLQVSAYIQFLRDMGYKVKGGRILSLLNTGKYALHEVEEDFPAFLSSRDLFIWSNKDKCKAAGYFNEKVDYRTK